MQNTNIESLKPAARLRQLLFWMKIPTDVVQSLDMAWLSENFGTYSAHPHYPEARAIIITMLEPDRSGNSRRLRKNKKA